MASNGIKDFFCEQCQLQFDKKIVFDIHLKIVHKENRIKSELVDTKNDICIETSDDFSLFEEPINGISSFHEATKQKLAESIRVPHCNNVDNGSKTPYTDATQVYKPKTFTNCP